MFPVVFPVFHLSCFQSSLKLALKRLAASLTIRKMPRLYIDGLFICDYCEN